MTSSLIAWRVAGVLCVIGGVCLLTYFTYCMSTPSKGHTQNVTIDIESHQKKLWMMWEKMKEHMDAEYTTTMTTAAPPLDCVHTILFENSDKGEEFTWDLPTKNKLTIHVRFSPALGTNTSIGLRYQNATYSTPWYGSPESRIRRFHLSAGERIVAVKVWSGEFVTGIQFTTSGGREHGPYGSTAGEESVSENEGGLRSIVGRAGAHIYNLQFWWRC